MPGLAAASATRGGSASPRGPPRDGAAAYEDSGQGRHRGEPRVSGCVAVRLKSVLAPSVYEAMSNLYPTPHTVAILHG